MSRSAFSLITSRLRRAISSCSGFIWPRPGKACCGSSASFFTQSRNCDTCTPRSCAACTYDTPRSLIRRTASSLNSRVNFRLSMTHLQLHQNTLTRCLRNRVQPRGAIQADISDHLRQERPSVLINVRCIPIEMLAPYHEPFLLDTKEVVDKV